MDKVMPGQEIEIRASVWNSFVDAAGYVKVLRENAGAERGRTALPCGMVHVRNASGRDMEIFSVMSLPDLAISPEDRDDPDGFKFGEIVFEAEIAEEDKADPPLCILRQPLADREVGRALVLGVTHGTVDVSDSAHKYAVPGGEPGKLKSAEDGAIEILWKGAGTGEQPCVLKMGGGGSADFSFPFKLYTSGNEDGGPVLCMKQGRAEIQSRETLGANFRFGSCASFSATEQIGFDFSGAEDGDYIVMGWIQIPPDGLPECGILIGPDATMSSSYEYPNGCGFYSFTIGVVTKSGSEDGGVSIVVKKQLAYGTVTITDRYMNLPFVPHIETEVPETSALAAPGSVSATRAAIPNAPCYHDEKETYSNLTDAGTDLARGNTYFAYILEDGNGTRIEWTTSERPAYEHGSADPGGPPVKRTLAAKIEYSADGGFRTFAHHFAPYRGGADTYKVKINNTPEHRDSAPDYLELKLRGDEPEDGDGEKYPDAGYVKHLLFSEEETPTNLYMRTVWDYKGISGYNETKAFQTIVSVKGTDEASLKWDDYGKVRIGEEDANPGFLREKLQAGRNIEFVWSADKLKIESRSIAAGSHIRMTDTTLEDGHRVTTINALPPVLLGGRHIDVIQSPDDSWTFTVDCKLTFSAGTDAGWLLEVSENGDDVSVNTKIGAPPGDDEYFLSSDRGTLKWSPDPGKVKVTVNDSPGYLEEKFIDTSTVEFEQSNGCYMEAEVPAGALISPSQSVVVAKNDVFTLDVNWSQVVVDPSLSGLVAVEYLPGGSGVKLKSALSGNGILVVSNGNISVLEGQENCLLACTGGGFSWLPYADCQNACDS